MRSSVTKERQCVLHNDGRVDCGSLWLEMGKAAAHGIADRHAAFESTLQSGLPIQELAPICPAESGACNLRCVKWEQREEDANEEQDHARTRAERPTSQDNTVPRRSHPRR
jgi:hypothetical protein